MFRLKTNLINKELNVFVKSLHRWKKKKVKRKLKEESVGWGETDRSSLFTLTEMWEV